ncbi:MAG: HNH endonuclease domain-containing protein [Spirochaetota bacterium]
MMINIGNDSKIDLPESGRVDVAILSRLLDDTTTSYKYFFFLALLDRIEKASTVSESGIDRPIPLDGLAVDMVLAAWYPHGFCRLSLGSQDMLQHAVDLIEWGPIRGSWIKAGGKEWKGLRSLCAARLDAKKLVRFVPFRLIRPFFAMETRGLADHSVNERVALLADELLTTRRPLYFFTADRAAIVLQHDWIEYLERNATILRGWARFKLAGYLQSRNPNAVGIVEKLEPPLVRASLAKQTAWWKVAIPLLGASARCIYTDEKLAIGAFTLDHYLPWSFVAHDRLWNLVPAAHEVNSAKSDRLPSPRYLEPFVRLQHGAIRALHGAWSEGEWLAAVEPYLIDLGLPKEALLEADPTRLRSAYAATLATIMPVAERQGFAGGWEYG